MGRRHHNHRLAKTHRSYTVEEAARLFGVHRNTVRGWIRAGLPTLDRVRPTLINGADLADFLQKRRQLRKRPCAAGEIYCVRCRAPRRPARDEACYQPITPTTGNLVGICPECSARMFRRVNRARLEAVQGDLAVQMEERPAHISESLALSVNCAFSKEPTT